MDIIISNSSGRPIYEQIAAQIKTLIITGTLHSGETLPSMRVLAKELRISVITTKRAYEELERDGFIETVTGRGSFVAEKNLELVREANLRAIEEKLTEAADLAARAGINTKSLFEMLELICGTDESGTQDEPGTPDAQHKQSKLDAPRKPQNPPTQGKTNNPHKE
jgi:GntR family transcriptional regulator